MKTININEATAPQLVAFAQSHLNIEGVSTSMAKSAIIAKMRAVQYDKDTIDVEDPARGEVKQLAEGAHEGERMIKIMIPSDDKPGGNDPVPVGNNGSVMLIPRNDECLIPYRFYAVLKDAVREVFDPLPGGGLGPARKVPAYPFQVIV